MPFIFRNEFKLVKKCHRDEKEIRDEDRIKPMYTELDPELNREMEDRQAKDPSYIDARDYHYGN